MDFDWDDANEDHLSQKHRIWPQEAAEVFYNMPVLVEKGFKKGELRYRIVGRTNEGRLLTVIYTVRDGKIRIVTAFDSGLKDARKYKGWRGKNA